MLFADISLFFDMPLRHFHADAMICELPLR